MAYKTYKAGGYAMHPDLRACLEVLETGGTAAAGAGFPHLRHAIGVTITQEWLAEHGDALVADIEEALRAPADHPMAVVVTRPAFLACVLALWCDMNSSHRKPSVWRRVALALLASGRVAPPPRLPAGFRLPHPEWDNHGIGWGWAEGAPTKVLDPYTQKAWDVHSEGAQAEPWDPYMRKGRDGWITDVLDVVVAKDDLEVAAALAACPATRDALWRRGATRLLLHAESPAMAALLVKEGGADLAARTSTGASLLRTAGIEQWSILLGVGVDPDVLDKSGCTVLDSYLLAVARGNDDLSHDASDWLALVALAEATRGVTARTAAALDAAMKDWEATVSSGDAAACAPGVRALRLTVAAKVAAAEARAAAEREAMKRAEAEGAAFSASAATVVAAGAGAGAGAETLA